MRMSLSVCRICRQALGLACVLSCYLALQTPASALTKLVVQAGNPAPDFGYVGLYVTQKAGFFKQEGLDVEIRHVSNSSQAVARDWK
jgi:NitT/TauT family transport system substrate-binding protein